MFFSLSWILALHLDGSPFVLSELHHVLKVFNALFQNMCHIRVLLTTSWGFLKVVKNCLVLCLLHLHMLIVVCHINSLRLREVHFMGSRWVSLDVLPSGSRVAILSRWALVRLIDHLLICAQKVRILLNFLSLARCSPSGWGLLNLLALSSQWLFHDNLLLLLGWVFSLLLLLVDH